MERRNELTDHDIANQLFIAATYGNDQLRMEQFMENIDIGELTVILSSRPMCKILRCL